MSLLNIKQVLRSLRNNKIYSFITVFGLAVGMAATILLFIYTLNEFSYDRFNPKCNRIYRINTIFKEETTNIWTYTIAFNDSTLQKQIPEIEELVQIFDNNWFSNVELIKDNVRFKNIKLIYSNANIYKVFPLKYIKGDQDGALKNKNSIVLSRSTAEKIFGSIDVLGKSLQTSDSKDIYTITGIVDDFPSNSVLDFNAIAPIESTPFNIFHSGLEVFTYVLFREKANQSEGIRKTKECYNRILSQRMSGRISVQTDCSLQRLADIHLKSDFQSKNGYNASFKKVLVYLSMALVVLLIAIINFINLLTAQYEGKSKEIGIQKAIGASRWHIAKNFLGRSISFSFIALIIAAILVEFSIPSVGRILNRDLISTYRNNFTLIAGLPAFAVVVGLISGLYPALFISKFSPELAIKGDSARSKGSNSSIKVLVVLQFAISIFLISNLIVMSRQISYMKNADLGFDAGNVLVLTDLNDKVDKAFPAIKDALEKVPEIKSIGPSYHLFGMVASGQQIDVSGEKLLKDFVINEYRVFPGFFETLGFKLIEGRSFDANSLSDKRAVILNETAVKMLGLKDPLNASIDFFDKLHVIGVVKDFHYYPLEERIEPMMFTYYNNHVRNIALKISGGNTQAVLQKVEKIIKGFDSGYVLDYVVVNDFCRNRYGAHEQKEALSKYATILSIVLALLGLYALSMFMVQKRTKEIGIRKVNGASRIKIVKLLLMVYTRQVAVAFVIAAPVAYFVLQGWLNNFAYRIKLTPVPFIVAGLLALAVALITVAGQTWRAAGRNPVLALKHE